MHAIRQASKASDETYYFSQLNKCKQHGKSVTLAFLLPRSKYLIFGSGTPRQKRDFGYGLPH